MLLSSVRLFHKSSLPSVKNLLIWSPFTGQSSSERNGEKNIVKTDYMHTFWIAGTRLHSWPIPSLMQSTFSMYMYWSLAHGLVSRQSFVGDTQNQGCMYSIKSWSALHVWDEFSLISSTCLHTVRAAVELSGPTAVCCDPNHKNPKQIYFSFSFQLQTQVLWNFFTISIIQTL